MAEQSQPRAPRLMSDTDKEDWELLSEFAERRDELDPSLVLGLLANTLRDRGYASIVQPDHGVDNGEPESRVSGVLGFMALWGLGASGALALGLPWYLAPVGFAAAVALMLVAIWLTSSSPVVAALVLASWPLIGLLQVLEGEFSALLVAYLIPIGLGIAYGLATRALRLREAQDVALALAGIVRSAPLIAPVVLIVLFLPALSADVWRIAGQLSLDAIVVVGVLSVGLLLAVVRLQLRGQLEETIHHRAQHLSDNPARAELTRRQVSATVVEEASVLIEEISDARIADFWPVAGEEYSPYLRAAAGKTLLAPLSGRLSLTVVIVGVLFSAYVYALCLAVVPVEIASEWSRTATPSTEISAAGASVSLYGGPYLGIAALLGLAATATFLSFALVEERFATALTDALLREPSDRLLVVALPYLALWEAAIEEGRSARVRPQPDTT